MPDQALLKEAAPGFTSPNTASAAGTLVSFPEGEFTVYDLDSCLHDEDSLTEANGRQAFSCSCCKTSLPVAQPIWEPDYSICHDCFHNKPAARLFWTAEWTSSMHTHAQFCEGCECSAVGLRMYQPKIVRCGQCQHSNASMHGLTAKKFGVDADFPWEEFRKADLDGPASTTQVTCDICLTVHATLTQPYLAKQAQQPNQLESQHITTVNGKNVCEWCALYSCNSCGQWNVDLECSEPNTWKRTDLMCASCNHVGSVHDHGLAHKAVCREADRTDRRHCPTCLDSIQDKSLFMQPAAAGRTKSAPLPSSNLLRSNLQDPQATLPVLQASSTLASAVSRVCHQSFGFTKSIFRAKQPQYKASPSFDIPLQMLQQQEQPQPQQFTPQLLPMKARLQAKAPQLPKVSPQLQPNAPQPRALQDIDMPVQSQQRTQKHSRIAQVLLMYKEQQQQQQQEEQQQRRQPQNDIFQEPGHMLVGQQAQHAQHTHDAQRGKQPQQTYQVQHAQEPQLKQQAQPLTSYQDLLGTNDTWLPEIIAQSPQKQSKHRQQSQQHFNPFAGAARVGKRRSTSPVAPRTPG